MKDTGNLSIIIVSWNSKDDLRNCLKSIQNNKPSFKYEIFVVDNGSHDNTPQMVKSEFREVRLIANRQNYGFAKANNQALREASGRYLLLLNPDTVIKSQALTRAIRYLDQNPKTGILGCKILNSNGTLQKSVRRFPTLISQIIILLKLHHFFPKLDPIKGYLAYDFDYAKKQNVDQVMGAFFMISRECFKEVGALDEKFWIWFEEVDFCKRAIAKGWKVEYNPDFEITHLKGKSFTKLKALKEQFIFNRSLFHYFKKHHTILEYIILLLFYPISMIFAFLVEIFESLNQPSKERNE